ncbi:DNA/RNA non-specific endonuclease [Erythrobacter sp.]|uniref:DNA/RNA non-specific endonuclease n=1 Tax=Erythrobacter sp. TaxID=1042 RepID=UPI003C746CA5
MKRFLIPLLLLAAPQAAFAEQFRCSGAAVSPIPAKAATNHDHGRYAPSDVSSLSKSFTAFDAVFDDADDDDGDGEPDLRLNPEYVIYEMFGVSPDASGEYAEPDISIRRPSKWYASPELVPLVEPIPDVTNKRLDDSYSGIGTIWNRGHLAMADHAQRIDGPASCNTHNFWNGSPQAAALNQGPWLHLENYSAAAANKFRSIWIVTGPIFDPATPKLTIGDADELKVEIPDAFFKILISEGPSGIETLAFIFEQPNELGEDGTPVPSRAWVRCSSAKREGHVYNHGPNLVPISEIERRTGLRLFHGHPERDAIVSAEADALWAIEERYWDPGPGVCGGQRSHPR